MTEDRDNSRKAAPSELYSEDSQPSTVGNNKGWVRYVANGMQLVGYYLLIHDGFTAGLAIKGISDLLIMTWGVYNKLWDVVVVTAIFCVFNFQRLVEVTAMNEWQLFFYKAASMISGT